MAFGYANLPSLTILSGSSGGSYLTLVEDAYGVSIVAPATLSASNALVMVGQTTSGVTGVLQSGGVDVTLAQGKSLTIAPCAYKALAVQSTFGGGEGADRVFTLAKVFLT